MQTPTTSSTSKPTNEGKTGSSDMKPVIRSQSLDPWEIAELLICKRDEQLISIEFATDNEFDAWVKTNSIPIKENGITGWTFDDRCRLVNHVLAQGGTLLFVDGTMLPTPNENNSESADKPASEEQ